MIRAWQPRWTLRVAVALMAGALPAFATPAAAATGDLVCPASSFQIDFTPALSAVNPKVDVSGSAGLGGCTPAPGYASASVTHVKGTAALSPTVPVGVCGLAFTATGTGVFEWSPAGPPDSQFAFTVSTDPTSPSGVTLSARVTSGPFAGDTATAAGTVVPNADCALHGLSTLTSTNTVVSFA